MLKRSMTQWLTERLYAMAEVLNLCEYLKKETKKKEV